MKKVYFWGGIGSVDVKMRCSETKFTARRAKGNGAHGKIGHWVELLYYLLFFNAIVCESVFCACFWSNRCAHVSAENCSRHRGDMADASE